MGWGADGAAMSVGTGTPSGGNVLRAFYSLAGCFVQP